MLPCERMREGEQDSDIFSEEVPKERSCGGNTLGPSIYSLEQGIRPARVSVPTWRALRCVVLRALTLWILGKPRLSTLVAGTPPPGITCEQKAVRANSQSSGASYACQRLPDWEDLGLNRGRRENARGRSRGPRQS